jgi:hypothetical protein
MAEKKKAKCAPKKSLKGSKKLDETKLMIHSALVPGKRF